MLQTFLQQFIPAMEEGLMLGVPLGVLFVMIRRLPHEDYRRAFRSALKWGFWLSIFLVAVRFGTRNAVSRELLEGAATFVTLIAEAVILSKLLSAQSDLSKPLKFSIAAAVATLFLYHGFELWLIPTGSVVAALGDYFTVEFLTKIGGFVSGGLFAFISSFMVFKAADALNQARLKFVFVVIFAACMIRQVIFLVQVLMARNVLSGEVWMDLMAPIINNSGLLIFVIFAAILVLPITLF